MSITLNEVEIEVICHPEYTEVRGNVMDSGDDEADRAAEDEILERLEWNEWVWCTVEVRATFDGISESDYLGCCSYESERDFRENSGYYQDMVEEARNRLEARLTALCEKLHS